MKTPARPWLAPLVPLYACGVAWRSAGFRWGWERVESLRMPVVSVGSLSAGGAGKTPFVIALARLLSDAGLADAGLAVDVLSRGYGRRDTGAVRVDPAGEAREFGDEPLLIAREAGVPVYVAARRVEAGRLAEQEQPAEHERRASLHLLDDGFQHRQLGRDLDIALVSSTDLADWLLPAGNLREGRGALRRAHVLAVEARDTEAMLRLRKMGLEQPVWRYRRRMRVPPVKGPVVAFCGIARPEQFFAGLEAAGCKVIARRAFRDHHVFGEQDLAELRRRVADTGAVALMTTGKDRIRLGEGLRDLQVYTAELTVEFEDPDGVLMQIGQIGASSAKG